MKSYKPILTMFSLLLTLSIASTQAFGQGHFNGTTVARTGNQLSAQPVLRGVQGNPVAQQGVVGRGFVQQKGVPQVFSQEGREQYQIVPRSGLYNPRFAGDQLGQSNLQNRYSPFGGRGDGQFDRSRFGSYGGYRPQNVNININVGGGYRPGYRPIFGGGLLGYQRYAFGGVYLDFDFCAGPGFVAYPWVYYPGWGRNPWFGYGNYGYRPRIAWGQSFTYMVDETQDEQVAGVDGQLEYDEYNQPIMQQATVAVAYTAMIGPGGGYGYYGRNHAWIGIHIGRW